MAVGRPALAASRKWYVDSLTEPASWHLMPLSRCCSGVTSPERSWRARTVLLLDASEGEPWRSADEVRGAGDGPGWLRGLSIERGGDGGEGGRDCAIGLLGLFGLFDCGWSH